jgi:hypothetical protein
MSASSAPAPVEAAPVVSVSDAWACRSTPEPAAAVGASARLSAERANSRAPARQPVATSAAWRYGLVVALACQGAATNAHSNELVGGWSNEQNQLTCVSEDGRMWIGDSRTELTGASYCTVTDDGTAFACMDPMDESNTFHGSLAVAVDELTLEILDCPAEPADCRATYRRDVSVICE